MVAALSKSPAAESISINSVPVSMRIFSSDSFGKAFSKSPRAVLRLPVRFSANSQESLYLPQRGLQLQRGTELGNGIGVGALEEQQHSEVAEGVDVPGSRATMALNSGTAKSGRFSFRYSAA